MSEHSAQQKTVTLKIKNCTSEIARMSLWLTGSLSRCGLSRELQFKFDLCANEAVTNIIDYGYPTGGEHEISLHLSVDSENAQLTIEDNGIAFNPLNVPAHIQPKSIQEARVGGLGIDLIRHYMDDVRYVRANNANNLSMQINLPKQIA